jgi:tyrosinase
MARNTSVSGRAFGRGWPAAALFLGLFLVVICHPKAALGQEGADFSGFVTDQQGEPIANARIEVNGLETFSGDDGSFKMSVQPTPTEGPYLVNVSHLDFADASSVFYYTLPTGQTWQLVRAQIEMVEPKSPIRLVDTRPELASKGLQGATFELPPDALVDEDGNLPEGPLRAAIATLDVGNGEGPNNWAVRSDDGQEDGYLISFGAVHILFTDPTGEVRYQLRKGVLGRLSLPVIPTMQEQAPVNSMARFWYYDTKDGYWKNTGDTFFNQEARAYVGTVDHLSTINTDIAKFNNAACLRVDLDASVPFGHKLRIRYHSGGTAFGQTPTLVMNDPVNAVYRLPASTNVLLELLNGSNQVLGNLVVEAPPGTPLVNTVVNTGPPTPSLFPPPPYTPCKHIRLRLALPQVEIRINELSTDPANLADNPTDDYITWAPTFARIRLNFPLGPAVTAVLTNDPAGAIPGGGDVLFAAHVSPWPANTTATANTLTLTLPGNGAWVPFVIAGKFGTPSTNDKDTIIQAHHNTAAGAVIGTKALMVRVRKNANNLTASERNRFLFAWRNFRNQLGSNYILFQEMHRLASTAGDEAHGQPAFLPWHRAQLLHVERELQKIDPSVALHYWNWDAAAPNIFHQDFMGAADMSVGAGGIAEPIFAVTNPLNGWNTDLPFSGGELRRNGANHTLAPVAGIFKPLDHPVNPSLVDRLDYGPRAVATSFSREVEVLSHNPAHGWPCGGGHVTAPVRSAADPLFYLLHSQIDRQWAYWQRAQNRHGVIVGPNLTFPAPAHYDNNGNWNDPFVTAWQKGSFLEDGMWPWDGTSGGTAGTRDERPLNQATAPGQNIPLSQPAVPMTQFPASPRRNWWPAAATVPKPRHTIDYLGRFRPQDGLGFCYDDVPYN